MKAVDYTVNSPHLVFGSESVADLNVETRTRVAEPLSHAVSAVLWK